MSAPVDVLSVIRRHAESHRASAGSDAYSAQEAPRLEATLAAVADLIQGLRNAVNAIEQGGLDDLMCCGGHDCGCRGSTNGDLVLHDLRKALARVRGAA